MLHRETERYNMSPYLLNVCLAEIIKFTIWLNSHIPHGHHLDHPQEESSQDDQEGEQAQQANFHHQDAEYL